MFIKRSMTALLSTLIALLILSGCNAQNSSTPSMAPTQPDVSGDTSPANRIETNEPITIRLTEQESQNSSSAQEMFQQFIEDAKSRGITIDHYSLGGDEPRTKVKAEFAAGDPPDIFYWNVGSNLKELVDAELILEVNDFFANSKSLSYDMWSEGGWANVSLDGGKTHWGFPITTQYTTLIANKDLFEKYNLSYPKTYEELLQVSDVFTANGIFPLGVGSKIGNPSHFTFDTIMHNFVPMDYTIGFFDGTSKFDCPEINRAGHYIQEMQNKGVMTSDSMAYGDWSIYVELFNTGKAAMITLHPWIASEIDSSMNIEVIDWWKFPDTTVDPNSFYIGGTNAAICITKAKYYESDRRQQAIQEIVEFYLNDDMVKNFVQGGIVPPRSSFKFDLASEMDPITAAVYKHLEGKTGLFFAWGNMPNSAVAASYTLDYCDALWAGVDTPENLSKKLQALMDENY